jgi:hypothetical protein
MPPPPRKKEKIKEYHFLKSWISLWRARGFSWSLEVFDEVKKKLCI